MTMTRWTFVLSLFLIVLGVAAWLGTGRQSVTALIPTFLGLPLLLLAWIARRARSPRVALGVATGLVAVGAAGTASGLLKSVRLLAGQTLERPEAAVAQALVALACFAWLALAAVAYARLRRAAPASAQGR